MPELGRVGPLSGFGHTGVLRCKAESLHEIGTTSVLGVTHYFDDTGDFRLDTTAPYGIPSTFSPADTPYSKSDGSAQGDSPSLALTNPDNATERGLSDHFIDYFMYRSGRDKAIPVTLSKVIWSWKGAASHDPDTDSPWQKEANKIQHSPDQVGTPAVDLPLWTNEYGPYVNYIPYLEDPEVGQCT